MIKTLAPSAKYLDNNFWIIAPSVAGKICKPFNGLPRYGYERIVEFQGREYGVSRTGNQGKIVWAIRPLFY